MKKSDWNRILNVGKASLIGCFGFVSIVVLAVGGFDAFIGSFKQVVLLSLLMAFVYIGFFGFLRGGK